MKKKIKFVSLFQASATNSKSAQLSFNQFLTSFKITLLIFLLLNMQTAHAQWYNLNNVNAKTVEAYNKIVNRMSEGYVKEAIPVLQKIILLDTNFLDAQLSLAGAYGEIKNYNSAVFWYEKVKQKDDLYFQPYNLPYSINLAGQGKFNDALQAVNQFLSIQNINERLIKSAEYRKKCYEFAVDYQKKYPQNNYVFTPQNLGDSVNSSHSEYYPSLSIDDSLLVFTRRGEGIREDFFESNMRSNTFSPSTKINGTINNQPSKGAITVSADGTWLIFAGNFQNGFGDFDLYISYLTDDGWSEPENLGPNINTEFWESSPSLSPDNRVLYFSSDRSGGYGGRDLYYSIRQKNGHWGAAINMGSQINTVGDEMAPYIHADNQTLYFTSNGLQGYGGTDLFLCRKDSLGNWGKPQNLGYPVNTIENEGSICISADGATAYYASDRTDSRGGLDLYKFILREDIRPHKTFYVKGTVFDAVTQKGIPCSVDLIENNTNQPLMHLQTGETGKYFVPLPAGNNYTFTVNRKGYLLYSDLYLLADKPADSTYEKNIPLQPLSVNASVRLKNIQFPVNSYELLPVSKIELDKLVELMKDNPTLHIQVNGHTDSTGTNEINLALSKNRAKAVAQYLVDNGIEAVRLAYKGFGATQPIAANTTEEGKALNRRTEIVVTQL